MQVEQHFSYELWVLRDFFEYDIFFFIDSHGMKVASRINFPRGERLLQKKSVKKLKLRNFMHNFAGNSLAYG